MSKYGGGEIKMKKFVLALIVCLTFFVVACTTNVTLDVKTKIFSIETPD